MHLPSHSVVCQSSTATALPLHSPQGKCSRCRESCSACATRPSAARREGAIALSTLSARGAMMAGKAPSSSRPDGVRKTPFLGENARLPPPSFEAAFPAFTASSFEGSSPNFGAFRGRNEGAFQTGSEARFPRSCSPQSTRRGAFHPHRCLFQWCDRRHFHAYHVWQRGKRTKSWRPPPCPSCSLNRMH